MKKRSSENTVRRGPLVPTDKPMGLPFNVDLFPEVRTLADLGLTEARARALSTHSHPLATDHYALQKILPLGRVLHEAYGFLVVLVTKRVEHGDEEQGDVFAYRCHSREERTNNEAGLTETAHWLGAIDLSTGRFVDTIEHCEGLYARQGAA